MSVSLPCAMKRSYHQSDTGDGCLNYMSKRVRLNSCIPSSTCREEACYNEADESLSSSAVESSVSPSIQQSVPEDLSTVSISELSQYIVALIKSSPSSDQRLSTADCVIRETLAAREQKLTRKVSAHMKANRYLCQVINDLTDQVKKKDGLIESLSTRNKDLEKNFDILNWHIKNHRCAGGNHHSDFHTNENDGGGEGTAF